MESVNDYTGGTTILGAGGTLTVRDGGTLSGVTNQIDINYGTLTIENNAGLFIDNNESDQRRGADQSARWHLITLDGRENLTAAKRPAPPRFP